MKKKIFRISTVPTSLFMLLKGQLKMLGESYEIVAVSSNGEIMQLLKERERVRVVEIPMERRISIFRDILSLFRMIFLFLRERPDMIHSITPKAGLISMLAGWITGVPVRMHTFTGLVFPTATGNLQRLLIWMDRLTCACATHINPEGEGVKRDLINYGITKKPLNIIANGNVNGVDLIYFNRTEEILEQAKKIRKSNIFTYCFVGRLVRDKGINELVSAFVRLYQQNSSIRLLLVGTFERELDPLLPETEKLIQTHPGIEAVGFQNDVRPYFAASDAFVFPSYREGFPNVVLQAGAMGLPSIVTDINGCNEIIIPGQNGVVIPSKDEQVLYLAMEQFLNTPENVRQMATKARQMVASRYDQKLVWDALLKEYRNLLGE